MKLIIFTPVIRTSAIGGCSHLLSKALAAQGHEIIVVRTEHESLFEMPTHDFDLTIIPWTDAEQVRKNAQAADALIYQIGDNYLFHQGGVEWLTSLPGIVCLHDFFLGHLFNGWAQGRRAQANEVLRIWYGEEIAACYFSLPNSVELIEGTKDVAPLTEWICSMALGVITHSNWGCERVLSSCPGPVRVVALAINKNANAESPSATLESDRSPHFQILTIGHINPNKRVESVIRAIGNSPLLRLHVIYRLVGAIQAEVAAGLSSLASDLDVKLVISGEVDEPTLVEAIEQSDVICCLRWPSLEAASASMIEALLNGRPVVVTDTGFYSEVPDACVLKIRPESEIADLQSALELLCNDVEKRNAVGKLGGEWARKTFTEENYARELVSTIEGVTRARITINAVEYLCGVMGQWSAAPYMLDNEYIVKPLNIFEAQDARTVVS